MTNEAVAEDENFEARAAYPSGGLGYELTREIPHDHGGTNLGELHFPHSRGREYFKTKDPPRCGTHPSPMRKFYVWRMP